MALQHRYEAFNPLFLIMVWPSDLLSIGPKVIIPGFYYFLSLIKTSYAVGDMLKMERNFIIVLFINLFKFFLLF